jgi:ABC-type sugar transport system ATPase subunit
MGANGAGKCTFIEVRSGIQELDGGTLVRWLGSTGFSVPRAWRWFVSLSK